MDAEEIDPRERQVLLDLFTEIAILEHLVRNRLKPDYEGRYTPAEFGLLNYFCRFQRDQDRLSHVAFSFEAPEEEIRVPLASLAARGLLIAGNEADPIIRPTDQGKIAFEEMILSVAPVVREIVEGIDPEALQITASTLIEIRRTVDNLPGR